jgi:hypothetical protein
VIQLSDAQIHSIRQQISRQVAFPEELSSTFDEALAHEFLRDVAECRTEEDLQSFTTLLPRRRLNDLFGALLVMSAAEGEGLVLRLLSILKQRITPSLAEIGWAFFQHRFPNDRMNRVLSTIVSEMPDKGSELPYLRAVAQVADLPIIDDTLPARMAMRLLLKPDLVLSNFFVEMTILPDSPFAAALLANFFMDASDQVIQDNASIFVHAVLINERETQVHLVNHYLQTDRLLPVWEPINLALLEKFGQPRSLQQQKLASLLGRSSDARFWDFLELPVINRFRQWEMLYQLDKHIGDSKRKRLFYKLCSMQIREISHWDDKTLVLIFDRFVLADHQDDPELIIYYDLNTYQILHDGNRYNVFLNKPALPSIAARQAVLANGKFNIVSLQLDAVNLLYARDFITEQLSPQKDMLN